MGERKCAFEGCNALEFRTSGYCLRHKNGTPVEKKFSAANTRVSPSTKSSSFSWLKSSFSWLKSSFSWWKMAGILYIAVPILLFVNILTHEEPSGSIAPTGLLNIPCFVFSLFPLFTGAFVKYLRSEHWLKRYRR